jgi:hypothetical protein
LQSVGWRGLGEGRLSNSKHWSAQSKHTLD